MLHLGSIGRTSIDVDFSFFILIGFFVLSFYDKSRGIQYALLWAPVLFLSILIHELAHAATIAAFGYGASHVVLGGMGGVTVNDRRAKPWHNFVISLAGPFSSFLLAFLTVALMRTLPAARRDPMLVAFLPLLVSANVWWGLFNLVPVAPLDGGHATRSFFQIFLRDRTAFVVAVWIAIVAGIALVIVGIVSGYYFLAILIAWYTWINVQQWQYFRRHGYPGD